MLVVMGVLGMGIRGWVCEEYVLCLSYPFCLWGRVFGRCGFGALEHSSMVYVVGKEDGANVL